MISGFDVLVAVGFGLWGAVTIGLLVYAANQKMRNIGQGLELELARHREKQAIDAFNLANENLRLVAQKPSIAAMTSDQVANLSSNLMDMIRPYLASATKKEYIQ
jgi:hypothetical protein